MEAAETIPDVGVGRPMGFSVTRLMVIGLSLFALASGCAGLRNTPAQDLAYERWRACEGRLPGVQLLEVEPGGRIRFWHLGGWDRAAMLDCLGQAARGGPSLPEPLAVQRPRGA